MAFNSLPFEGLELSKFEAAGVRNLVNRPKYERMIMLAALQEQKSVELVYNQRVLADTIHSRLTEFGFFVEKVRSRKGPNDQREFYFKVSW